MEISKVVPMDNRQVLWTDVDWAERMVRCAVELKAQEVVAMRDMLTAPSSEKLLARSSAATMAIHVVAKMELNLAILSDLQ